MTTTVINSSLTAALIADALGDENIEFCSLDHHTELPGDHSNPFDLVALQEKLERQPLAVPHGYVFELTNNPISKALADKINSYFQR